MNFNFLSLLYYILVVTFAGVSAYLSYFGFLKNFNELAIVWALMIGLWLIGSNVVIHRARLRDDGLIRGVALFAFGAIFSFVSNFNYLYTNKMQQEVAAETVSEAYETLRNNLVSIRATLSGTSQIDRAARLREDFDREMNRLYRQITDPFNPGIGGKAREHIERIYDLLGARLTGLQQPEPGSSAADKRWFDAFKEAAEQDLQTKMSTTDAAEFASIISLIDRNLEQHSTPPTNINSYDPAQLGGQLQEFSTRSQEIRRRANALLPVDQQVEIEAISFLDGRLGEIEFSLVNGFITRPSPGATILAAVIALAVDVLPLLFVLLAFRPLHSQDEAQFHRGIGTRNHRTNKGLT